MLINIQEQSTFWYGEYYQLEMDAKPEIPKVQNVLNVQLALYLTSQQMYVDWAFKDVKSTETNGLTEMKGSLAAVASSAM